MKIVLAVLAICASSLAFADSSGSNASLNYLTCVTQGEGAHLTTQFFYQRSGLLGTPVENKGDVVFTNVDKDGEVSRPVLVKNVTLELKRPALVSLPCQLNSEVVLEGTTYSFEANLCPLSVDQYQGQLLVKRGGRTDTVALVCTK